DDLVTGVQTCALPISPDHPTSNLQLDDTIGAVPAYECSQLPVKCARRVRVHAVAREAVTGVEGFDILVYRLAKRPGCCRPYPNQIGRASCRERVYTHV